MVTARFERKTGEHAVVVFYWRREKNGIVLGQRSKSGRRSERRDMMLIVIADNMIVPIVDCHVECER